MPRPRKCRKVCRLPANLAFLPENHIENIPAVILTVDEYETIRLIDKEGFSQEECGAYMQVARTTVQQSLMDYKRLGYSDNWINQRLKSIEIRKDLTDQWKAHNVEEGVGYATLTDIIYQAWASLTAREYKNLKGLHQENLRDNMTNEELVMNMLAELTTTNITKEEHPQTMSEHARVAERGGSVARVAKEAFEEQTGKKVVSSQSMKQYLESQHPKLDLENKQ